MSTVVMDNSTHTPLSAEAASLRDFGFWVYIMSDCILFATLFATFAVLSTHFAGGPSPASLFDLQGVLLETLCLLLSSITYGFAMLAMKSGHKQAVILWLIITALLGASFVGLELNEFSHLISEGHDWTQSAYLSAFFTLVSTHGLHVSAGLVWMIVMLIHIGRFGLTSLNQSRLMSLSLFWHFLDIVWIFVFTFVYLMGVANG
jgi:cytochrome o ubiquinol oxidase subunit 3